MNTPSVTDDAYKTPGAPVQPNDRSGNSALGALAVAPHLEEYRQKVYDFIKSNGPSTDEEIRNGCSMKPKTTTARRRELELNGKVRRLNFQRKNSKGRMVNVYSVVGT